MAVRRVETVEEIVKLHLIQDDVEEYMSCDRNEWVQWLVSEIETNPRLAVWADFDADGNISSYIVAINAVAPPLSDSVFIPYTWSTLGAEENQKVLEEIIMWSRAVGANTIRMETRDIDKFHRYGFKEVATVMELKI